jgi:hypothetical protein
MLDSAYLEPAKPDRNQKSGQANVTDELVSRIWQVSPRRQGIGEDREAGRPPDGRDAVPDHQGASPHAYQAATPTSAGAYSSLCGMVVRLLIRTAKSGKIVKRGDHLTDVVR